MLLAVEGFGDLPNLPFSEEWVKRMQVPEKKATKNGIGSKEYTLYHLLPAMKIFKRHQTWCSVYHVLLYSQQELIDRSKHSAHEILHNIVRFRRNIVRTLKSNMKQSRGRSHRTIEIHSIVKLPQSDQNLKMV